MHVADRGRNADCHSNEGGHFPRTVDEGTEQLAAGVGKHQGLPLTVTDSLHGSGSPRGIEVIAMRPFLFEPLQAARRRLSRDRDQYQPRRPIQVNRASTQDKVGVLPQYFEYFDWRRCREHTQTSMFFHLDSRPHVIAIAAFAVDSVGAERMSSHLADPNLSRCWTLFGGRSSVDKCRSSDVC